MSDVQCNFDNIILDTRQRLCFFLLNLSHVGKLQNYPGERRQYQSLVSSCGPLHRVLCTYITIIYSTCKVHILYLD